MPIVKDKKVLCQTGLADFSVESVNEVPFYKRYFEFSKLFARLIPSVDFDACFAQPQENVARKTIEWYFTPGVESPMKLSELKETDPELYQTFIQQRIDIVSHIKAAASKAKENEQKYFNAVMANLETDYSDSITYCYDGHILFGIWGMRTKTGRQIDSVITEDAIDHRAYKVSYQIKGKGRLSAFSSINRRYGHILHGDKDIPQVIPEEGYFFQEWEPEAPHGKEVKSDLVYYAVCEKIKGEGNSDDNAGLNNKEGANAHSSFYVRFNAGEHGTPQGQSLFEKKPGETVLPNEIPEITPVPGYRFVGWDRNPTGFQVNQDTEFFAVYEEVSKTHTVNFKEGEHGHLKGQTSYQKHDQEHVLTSEVPTVEPEEGYRFVGWDKNPDNYLVTSDTDFIAQYEEERKSWWSRFWGWGSGCLNWLLALLLLGLIGLLLWYLFGNHGINFCDCGCDEVVIDTIPYNPPVRLLPCEETTRAGNNLPDSVIFEMGQQGGSFVFEYATGNEYSDLILIYDGSNSSGPVIFRYEGKTGNGWGNRKQDTVRFTQSQVFIKIVPNSSDKTWWQIQVHCPGSAIPPQPTPPVDPEPPTPIPHSGDVQILLKWSNRNDLDLSCIDPYGDKVSYTNKTVRSGGELDVDMNASSSNMSENPIENIFWPTGGAPVGEYTVYVTYFSQKEIAKRETPYEIMVKHGDKEDHYSGVMKTERQEIRICSFRID